MKVTSDPIPSINAPDAELRIVTWKNFGRGRPVSSAGSPRLIHKDIGSRYIVTAFIFFVLAGILAMLMRIQLAFPENHFLGPDLYNQFFTHPRNGNDVPFRGAGDGGVRDLFRAAC